MPAIVLPSSPSPNAMTVHYVDWGGVLRPALGGAAQRLNRLGTRHRIEVTLPPLKIADARLWVQRLKRGVHEGVIMEFPQPGFDAGVFATPTLVSPVLGGSTIGIQGLPAGHVLKEGQWISILGSEGGVQRRYLHSIDADTVANASGLANAVGITPMLRTSFTGAHFVFIASSDPPAIQGSLTGDEQSWTVNNAHHYGLAFGIEEDA